MYSVKKQKSSIKALLISTVLLLLSCVLFMTSCPTGGASEIYKLELNGGSEDGYTKAIYYSPVDKAWYSDVEAKNEIKKVIVPSGVYTTTLYWNNSEIERIVGSTTIRQPETFTRTFKGYKFASVLWIDSEGNIRDGFSISKNETANAEFDQAPNYNLPSEKEINDLIDANSEVKALGYRFNGWVPNADSKWNQSTSVKGSVAVTSNASYYASYTKTGYYTLTIDWKGATGTAFTDKVYYQMDNGWYKDNELKESLKSITIPEKKWTIKFDKNIRDEADPSNQEIIWTLKDLGSAGVGTPGVQGSYLKDVTGTWNTDRTITGDATIVAEWETSKNIVFPIVSSSGHDFTKWVLKSDVQKEYSGKEPLVPLEIEDDVRNGVLEYVALWDNNNFAYIYLDNNGATSEEPSMLYYSLNENAEKKWYKEFDKEGIDKIDVPKKEWNVDFVSGYGDAMNPTSQKSTWTFDGYFDSKTGTRWINTDGTFVEDVKPTSSSVNLVARWIDQTTIELPIESETFNKPGMKFRGWSLSKDGSSGIINLGEYTPKSSEVLYAIWENMVYEVEFTEDSKGQRNSPISGVKNILLDTTKSIIGLKLINRSSPEVTPKFNTSLIDSDVSGWFVKSQFTDALLNGKFTVKEYSEDRSTIYIVIDGALKERPNGVVGANRDNSAVMGIEVPSTAIENNYNTSSIMPKTPIYYEVTDEVEVTLENGVNDDGETYYGTAENPIYGNPGSLIGDNGNGVLIRIKAKNAKFRDNLGEVDVKKWLKNINVWFANSNITNVTIDSSVSYSETEDASYITLRLRGIPSSEMTARKQTTLSIPYNDFVGGSASPDTVNPDISYRSEKLPQITVDTGATFKGSTKYPFTATPNVYIGTNGDGYTIRISLGEKRFKNELLIADSENENSVVKGWFTSNTITAGNSFGSVFGDNVRYYVVGGGVASDGTGVGYIDISVRGYTTHAPQSQEIAYFSIPNSDIVGLEGNGSQEIAISYVITDPVAVVVDTASTYRGGSDTVEKRLRIPYNINMGNGNGERIKLNVNNGYFSREITERTDVSSWITVPEGENLDISNITFRVAEVGIDRNYIIVSANGYSSSSSDSVSVGKLTYKVPYSAIAYSTPGLDVSAGDLHYAAGIKITSSLRDDRNSYYKGGQNTTLEAVPYTRLGTTGDGVQIQVDLIASDGYDFEFVNNLTNDEIKKWFTTEGDDTSVEEEVRKSFEERVGGNNLEYSYVSGAGTRSVIVNIKGYITEPDITFIPKIWIPYSSIKGAYSGLPNTNADFYITSTGNIGVVLSSESVPITRGPDEARQEYYRGYASQPVSGYDSMWLNSRRLSKDENDVQNGLPMKIVLNNAKWAKELTNDDIKSWFTFTDILETSVEITNLEKSDDNNNGKKGYNYVTILLKGHFTKDADKHNPNEGTPIEDARNYLIIPSNYIQNVSNDLPQEHRKAFVHHRATETYPIVSVLSKGEAGEYWGWRSAPISGAENIYLGNGEGVKVILGVNTQADEPWTFELPTETHIKNWLNWNVDENVGLPQLDPSSIGISDIKWGIKEEEGITEDTHQAIEFTLKGYFKSGSASDYNPSDGTALDNVIALDYHSFANSTPTLPTIYSDIYTKSLGPVELTLGTGENYVGGTSEKPILGTPYVNYGVIDDTTGEASGVRVELNLKNATFSTEFTLKAVEEMFSPFTQAINVGELSYTIEDGTGATYNRAVVVIKGFPKNPEIKSSFDLSLPSSCINAASPDIAISPVKVYYETNKIDDIIVSNDSGYYGSSADSRLKMTPNVKLGLSDDGLKIRLKLNESSTNRFRVESITEDVLKTKWFASFNNTVGGDNLKYVATSLDNGKSLDITISGYVTNPNISSVTSIRISPEYLEGTVQYFGDKLVPIYYLVTPSVTVELNNATGYYGTDITPIRSINNVVYGNGDGVLIQLKLSNAQFSTKVAENGYSFKDWFVNAPQTREYEYVGYVDATKKDTIIIRIKGYDTEVEGTKSYKIAIPQDAIEGWAVDTSIESRNDLWFNCLGTGGVSLSRSALYSGGDDTNPIKGSKNIMLTRDTDEKLGVRIRIELENLLFANLPSDDDLTSLGWFDALKDTFDSLTFTRVNGGNEESFVVVEMRGYPAIAVKEGSTIFSIPKANIKGASDVFEAKACNIYYETLDDVSVALSSESAFVGSEVHPLGDGLVKYVEFNNGTGVEVRLNLTNARFNGDTVLKKVVNSEGKEETKVSDDFASLLVANLPTEFRGIDGNEKPSVDYVAGGDDISFIRFILKGYVNSDTLNLSEYPINIPYKYLKNGGPISDETKFITTNWHCQTTDVVSVSAIVSSTGEYYGANGKPLEGTSNVKLGAGNGIKVRVELNNALFADVISEPAAGDENSSVVKSWFRDLNEQWTGAGLTYTLGGDLGSGPRSRYAIVTISGAPVFTDIGDNKRITLHIPGNHIYTAHYPSEGTTEEVTTSFYYSNKEKLGIAIESSRSGYVGSTSTPFTATPFINISDSTGNELLVRINLTDSNLSFKNDLTDSEVASWFNAANTELGGALQYKKRQQGQNVNYVVVAISGYVGSNKVGQTGTLTVSIPYDHVQNVLPGAGTFETSFNYNITGAVSATIGYNDSSSLKYIQGYNNILLNSNVGSKIRITLTNAKWKTSLTSEQINEIFRNIENSGFNLKGASYSQSFTSQDLSYIEVVIKGYPTTTTGLTNVPVELRIPSSCIENAVSGLGSVVASVNVRADEDRLNLAQTNSEDGKFRYGYDGRPITGTAKIKLATGTSDQDTGNYIIRITSSHARFNSSIKPEEVRGWMSQIEQYARGGVTYSGSKIAPDGTWIDITLTGSFESEYSGTLPIRVQTSALLYFGNPDIQTIEVYLSLRINKAPSFKITDSTLEYSQYERLDEEEEQINRRFVVSVEGATFTPNASSEIASNQTVSSNTKLIIRYVNDTTAHIYATGRFDSAFTNTPFVFTIPKSLVTNAGDNFNIKTTGSAIIDTSLSRPYFGINESVTITQSNLSTTIRSVTNDIFTKSFLSHGTSSTHINQTMNFYKVQKANVPYTTSDLAPALSQKLAHDYEIADIELTSGLYLTVLEWAINRENGKYTFFKPTSGETELFGFSYNHDGTFANRASTIDPVVGYPTSYRNAILFCNAFTEWWNEQKGLTGDNALSPVYVNGSGVVIRNFENIDNNNYPTEYIGNNDGFRLPSIAEWQYAAAISRDPLTEGFKNYNGSALLPDLVYAQSYADPSGFPSGSTDVSNVLTNYIIYNVNFGPNAADGGSQGVGTYVQSAPRKANLLGLYDMSGNVAEWTSTPAGSDARYVAGGFAGSTDSDIAVGSVKTQSVGNISSLTGYNIPVGIRLVRSLT